MELEQQEVLRVTVPGYQAVAVFNKGTSFEDRQKVIDKLEWTGTITWYIEKVGKRLVVFSKKPMLPYARRRLDSIIERSPVLTRYEGD